MYIGVDLTSTNNKAAVYDEKMQLIEPKENTAVSAHSTMPRCKSAIWSNFHFRT